jgi:hypothetical protein
VIAVFLYTRAMPRVIGFRLKSKKTQRLASIRKTKAAIVNLTIREGPHICNSRFGFVVARTQSYLPERGADFEQVLVSTVSR